MNVIFLFFDVVSVVWLGMGLAITPRSIRNTVGEMEDGVDAVMLVLVAAVTAIGYSYPILLLALDFVKRIGG